MSPGHLPRRTAVALVAGIALLVSAHVGSPDTFFDGAAGPYAIRVIVRTPGVVPGLAEITVRVTGDRPARLVTVKPVRWDAGLAGAPPPDTATAVTPDGKLFAAQLWLMTSGSYSVYVDVDGDLGPGQAIVPVVAVATRRLDMNRPLAVGLLALGIFLFVGALTIVRAAIRESVLEPGAVPDARRRRRAWVVTAATGLVIAGLLVLGRGWWNAVDASYRAHLYRPLETTVVVRADAGAPVLQFALSDRAWRQRQSSPLIPDHGKLLHLFLIRDPGLDAFAHLHPVALDSTQFDMPLPPLPAGRYRVYADVTFESGFSATLPNTLDIAADAVPARAMAHDPDDSWWSGPEPAAAAPTSDLGDGMIMTWDRPAPVVAGRDLDLRFAIRGPRGGPAGLQPYMGMPAHAVIAHEDGSVFIHLHPTGTISMAAQQAFLLRGPEDTVAGAVGRKVAAQWEGAVHRAHAAVSDTVTFPYSFPAPGRYRVWVQVRRGERILTGAFTTEVAPASSR